MLYTACFSGDGKRIGDEACDDSNDQGGDGCATDCTVEAGYECTGGDAETQDSCSPKCGDPTDNSTEALKMKVDFSKKQYCVCLSS